MPLPDPTNIKAKVRFVRGLIFMDPNLTDKQARKIWEAFAPILTAAYEVGQRKARAAGR